MVAHNNGQICKWAEYTSIFNFIKPEKGNTRKSTYVKCPKCGDRGRLNWAYDIHANKGERPFTFIYIVVHERIPGTWGKIKMKRRRRCQSFTPEQRIAILKQVGRYISDPPQPYRDTKLKELNRQIEPQSQNQNRQTNCVSNNELSKVGRTYITSEVLMKVEKDSRIQIKQYVRNQHKELLFVPKGKRLTTCIKCNKPGYKYRTYFQHYNEPPIGKVILKSKIIGDKYRRCYLTKQKVGTKSPVQS
jgi:hypothetical protein